MTGMLVLLVALLSLTAVNGSICDVDTILTQCPNIRKYIFEMESNLFDPSDPRRVHNGQKKHWISSPPDVKTDEYRTVHSINWPDEEYETTETDSSGIDIEDNSSKENRRVIEGSLEEDKPQKGFQSWIHKKKLENIADSDYYAGQPPVDGIWNVISGSQHNQWSYTSSYPVRKMIYRGYKPSFGVRPARKMTEEAPEVADNSLTWGWNGYRRI